METDLQNLNEKWENSEGDDTLRSLLGITFSDEPREHQ
jgi:hypothetical protein